MQSSSASSIAWGSGSKPRWRAAIAKPSAGRRSSGAAPKVGVGAAEGVDSIGRGPFRFAHLRVEVSRERFHGGRRVPGSL